MDIQVYPERLLLMVLKAPAVTDLAAWKAIQRDHQVPLSQVADAYSFNPRLTAQYVLSGASPRDLKTVVRFDYSHEHALVKKWYELHEFTERDVIQPQEPLLLEPLRQRSTNELTGLWQIATHVAFVRSDRLIGVTESRRRAYLENLRLTFKEVATFEFRVTLPVAMMRTGERRERLQETLINQTFSAADI